MTFVPDPAVSIEIGGEIFTGNDPNSVKLVSNQKTFNVTGRYWNAADHASSAVFSSQDEVSVMQGKTYNTPPDTHCNYQGGTVDGLVNASNKSNNFTVRHEVTINGKSYEASVLVSFQGRTSINMLNMSLSVSLHLSLIPLY